MEREIDTRLEELIKKAAAVLRTSDHTNNEIFNH